MKSDEMEHEMIPWSQQKCFVPDTPSFCDHTYMISVVTHDDADQLECVIGYTTSLYLVMVHVGCKN